MGGHYRETFRGDRGITQGNILSPTIFNVVVGALVRHWGSSVEERAKGDSSNDNRNMSHPAGRIVSEKGDGRRRVEEGHAMMTVKAGFLMWMTEWWLPPT